jgi:hypothetical protein
VEVNIYDENGVGSKIYASKSTPNMWNHIDDIEFAPVCGNKVVFVFSDYHQTNIALLEIEIIDSKDVYYVSSQGAQIILESQSAITVHSLDIRKPLKSKDCNKEGLTELSYWDEDKEGWANFTIDDTNWTIINPKKAKEFKLTFKGENANACAITKPLVVAVPHTMLNTVNPSLLQSLLFKGFRISKLCTVIALCDSRII